MDYDKRKQYSKKYLLKLRDPRWLAKREEILERDNWKCSDCGRKKDDITLQVHHIEYEKDIDPWDYPNENLITLCIECHFKETIDEEVLKFYLKHFFPAKLTKRFEKYLREQAIHALINGGHLL